VSRGALSYINLAVNLFVAQRDKIEIRTWGLNQPTVGNNTIVLSTLGTARVKQIKHASYKITKQATTQLSLPKTVIYFRLQWGIAHIYTVCRFATMVKLKVKSQFQIFSIVNSRTATFHWCKESNWSRVKQNINNKSLQE